VLCCAVLCCAECGTGDWSEIEAALHARMEQRVHALGNALVERTVTHYNEKLKAWKADMMGALEHLKDTIAQMYVAKLAT
jgi:hypothetical protein